MKRAHNVLIVTYYWPPSGGAGVQRFLKFVKYLPDFGVRPFVLVPENPTYPILDETLANDVPDELNVFRSGTIEPFSAYSVLSGKDVSDSAKPTVHLKEGSLLSKIGSWIRANIFVPDARAGWLLTARSKAASIIEEHDIDTIITTGPPHSVHFVGKYAKRKTGVRWIADFRDPWTQVYYNQMMPRTVLTEKIDSSLERSVLKSADEVIVISKSMAEIQKRIVDRNYTVIPNGFDPKDFSQFRDQGRHQQDQQTIRHIGSIPEGSVPYGLLNALSRLGKNRGIEVEFVGNVNNTLKKKVSEEGLENCVHFKPYVPHEEAIRLMCHAGLLLLSIPRAEDNNLILTGKIFEYLGSGTPILLLGPVEGDAARIVKETGQGICFEHDDVNGIAAFLERFSQSDMDFKQKSGIQGIENHPYSRVRLSRKLAELIASGEAATESGSV